METALNWNTQQGPATGSILGRSHMNLRNGSLVFSEKMQWVIALCIVIMLSFIAGQKTGT